VRAYLLGTLSDKEATAIEEKYFADRSFFQYLREKEEELIAEYLDGRLSASEKSLFEARYLRIPQLKQKLREVQQRRQVQETSAGWRPLALAGALSLVVAFSVWVYVGRRTSEPVEVAQVRPPAIASYSLTPGVLRSGGATANRIEAPRAGERVRLVLELPGTSASAEFEIRLLALGANGTPALTWKTPQRLNSTKSDGGQQIEVVLDSEVLSPNDYILEAQATNGSVQEKYLFRVVRTDR
jgi:hypothetical protein